jgi:uncharacterized membrane protein YfcA
VQGLSGFAFGMVALAFWVWVLPPDSAGPLVVACSLVGQALNGRITWQGLRMPAAWPFIAGGVFGIPVGAWLLPHLDANLFKLGFGLFLLTWCPVMLAVPRLPHVTAGGRRADAAAGWLGGVLGGISGLSGPVPTLWVTLRGWDKLRQRALFQAFNTTMHALALSAFTARGLVGEAELRLFAVAAPAMLLPLWLGTRLYVRIGDLGYRRIVIALLLVAGLVLIVNGIS